MSDGAIGERVIATYKTVKGALQIALAIALMILVSRGGVPALHEIGVELGHRATRRWSLVLAHLLAKSVTNHRVWISAIALAFDGVLTSIEGWALRRGHAWGRWVVVMATGVFLPFELVAFVRKRHWFELAAFVLNLAIVVYLARHALQRHREMKRAAN